MITGALDRADTSKSANRTSEADAQDRILNFLNNWVDANIIHASHESDGDASTMQYLFLTDAVASGLPLDEVNEEWAQAEVEIRKALNKRRSSRP